MMQCVSLSTPKKRQHSTRPCLHVMVCTNASCCVVWWVWGKKGKGQRHSQTKTKRAFPKTTFSLFPFFLPLFLPLFSPCLPLFHHHSLLIHMLTCFSCFTHVCVCEEPKTPMMHNLILFIIFSFCPNSLFPLLFLLPMIQC